MKGRGPLAGMLLVLAAICHHQQVPVKFIIQDHICLEDFRYLPGIRLITVLLQAWAVYSQPAAVLAPDSQCLSLPCPHESLIYLFHLVQAFPDILIPHLLFQKYQTAGHHYIPSIIAVEHRVLHLPADSCGNVQ